MSERTDISSKLSSKQKGDIAEARIAELIMLYGDETLSCYKPISDDEGIDLIVKKKGSLQTLYIQVKSRFVDSPNSSYVTSVKSASVVDRNAMAIVFCAFDKREGDLVDKLWLVPAPDFIKGAKKQVDGTLLQFFVGKEQTEWDKYSLDKRVLANKIIELMRRNS